MVLNDVPRCVCKGTEPAAPEVVKNRSQEPIATCLNLIYVGTVLRHDLAGRTKLLTSPITSVLMAEFLQIFIHISIRKPLPCPQKVVISPDKSDL